MGVGLGVSGDTSSFHCVPVGRAERLSSGVAAKGFDPLGNRMMAAMTPPITTRAMSSHSAAPGPLRVGLPVSIHRWPSQ